MKQSEPSGPLSRSRLWLAQTNRHVLDRLGQTQESMADLDPLNLLPLAFLDAQGKRLWQWVTPGEIDIASGREYLLARAPARSADGCDAEMNAEVVEVDIPPEAVEVAHRIARLFAPAAAPKPFRAALAQSLEFAATDIEHGVMDEDEFVRIVTRAAEKNVLVASLGKMSPWTVMAGVPVMVGLAAYMWRRFTHATTPSI